MIGAGLTKLKHLNASVCKYCNGVTEIDVQYIRLSGSLTPVTLSDVHKWGKTATE